MKKFILIFVTMVAGIYCLAQVPSVGNNGKYGYVQDERLVIPYIYDNAQSFNEDMAAVAKSSKYGFIDRSGKIIIPCTYKNVHACGFSDGVCGVTKNGKKWYFIDKQGNKINDEIYSAVMPYKNGMAAVFIDDKAFFVDKNGNKVIDKDFAYAEPFYEGIAVAGILDRSRTKIIYGFIDQNGNWLSASFYDEIYSEISKSPFAENGVVMVRKGDRTGYVNRQMMYYDTMERAVASSSELNVKQNKSDVSSNSPLRSNTSFSLPKNTSSMPSVYTSSSSLSSLVPNTVAPVATIIDDSEQEDSWAQTDYLGVILTYDLNSSYFKSDERNGGVTAGLGYKKYLHKNIFTWAGLAFNGYFSSSENNDFKTKRTTCSILLPLNVGCSFAEKAIEISTGPCLWWTVDDKSKSFQNGKEVEPLWGMEPEGTKKTKFDVWWDINVGIYSFFRCSLKIPLDGTKVVLLSIGLGF